MVIWFHLLELDLQFPVKDNKPNRYKTARGITERRFFTTSDKSECIQRRESLVTLQTFS